MSANRLYHTWFEQIRQLRPDERITRLRNLTWLMVGIYQSRSVHLSDVASKIPGRAKELSIARRLSRFLTNPAVRVREWYTPVARNLIQSMAQTVGEIRLIADGTKVGFNHQLLMIAIAYRRRMWIEEMFGDLKGNGFDLESTHLRHFARLSRLTLAVALLYVWLVSTGARTIKNGQRHWVDRKDRRDLSIFRIGLRWIERRLTNGLSFHIPMCPIYDRKPSGG
jgi:hypothetical protein